MSKVRILIIDIESYFFKAMNSAQGLRELEQGLFIDTYSLDKAREYINKTIDSFKQRLNAQEYVLVTGDRLHNFRKDILPSYKNNRPKRHPFIDTIANSYDTIYLKNLEADDTCRILYEDDNFFGEMDKVIVSIDKDFLSFPCKLYRPHKDEIREVDIDMAQYNLYKQIISGDSTDNYKGITGWGEGKTKKWLEFSREEKEVIQLFEDNGLTKDDYLKNKYMAQIISISQYNFNTGEVYYDR